MSVCLSTMIEKDFNLDEINEIIRFGFRTPGVRHISLLPSRRMGRNELTTEENYLDEMDLFEAIANQTDGRIKRNDWVKFFVATAALYKITGSTQLKPRRCFIPLPLIGTQDDFFPVTRPLRLLKDRRNLLAFMKMISHGGNMENASLSERSLLVTIETFREKNNIDLGDAMRCSRYYLSNGRLFKPCVYNTIEIPKQQAAVENKKE
jgi:uncharacterized radical SAM superfamily Fe-S cluster-containing enzyme